MTKEYRLLGNDYKFEPTGGPIDSPQENDDLMRALGLAQAAWSRMEHMVTALAIHINKAEASAALHDPDPADAFRRKIKLLESWLMKHPAYAHLVDADHARFFMHLKEMAQTRNTITHGHLRAYNRETKTFDVGTIKRVAKDVWRVQVLQFRIEALETITDLSNRANREFERIADAVFLRSEGDAAPQIA